jgi:hypothetical protein
MDFHQNLLHLQLKIEKELKLKELIKEWNRLGKSRPVIPENL